MSVTYMAKLQTHKFTFDDWETFLDWTHGQEQAKVYFPYDGCPDFHYFLRYNCPYSCPNGYKIVGVSHIVDNCVVPLSNFYGSEGILSREDMNQYKSDIFEPLDAGVMVHSTDTDEISWWDTFETVSKTYPNLVKYATREVREGRYPSEIYLQKLDNLVYTKDHGMFRGVWGLCIGELGDLYCLTSRDISDTKHLNDVREKLLELYAQRNSSQRNSCLHTEMCHIQ